MTASTLAITAEHVQLAEATIGQLRRSNALATARASADGGSAHPVDIWTASAGLGLFGLAVDEEYEGLGYGLPELTIVLESMGHQLCPGPFLTSAVLAAVLNLSDHGTLKSRYLPALAKGEMVGAIGFSDEAQFASDGSVSGRYTAVLAAPDADVLALVVGEDVVVLSGAAAGIMIDGAPRPLDTTRSIGTVTLTDVRVADDMVIRDGARVLRTVWRIALAAEAIGVARATVEAARDYAQVREQFGRSIGSFQAVKHHLADMFVNTEMSTASVWDAARAQDVEGAWFSAAVAAWNAARTALSTAEMNIQLHGGIGFTWEHDAHLYLRRARALATLLDNGESALADIVAAQRTGDASGPSFVLPLEADAYRAEAQEAVRSLRALPETAQRDYLVGSGYLVPHWPRPWGRGASPTEQLVIDEEFQGIDIPDMSITGWVMLTIVQAGSNQQAARWVEPVLRGREMWCQLFSEPNAGSDAAAVRTSAVKVEGGWYVSGQKVWTSGAHYCQWGLATVRTDPGAPKHAGVTVMAIDMRAKGVDVRPLRELTGEALFNEVFLDDVFVPDSDVIGDVGQGWRVARAALGNERVSIGGEGGVIKFSLDDLVALLDKYSGARSMSWSRRVGEVIAQVYSVRPLNIRIAARALEGAGPGPEANVTKLLKAESLQRMTELAFELSGADAITGHNPELVHDYLIARSLTIAGGTSEIMRNAIAERILGLPRDPLIK